MNESLGGGARRPHDLFGFDIKPVGKRPAYRDAHDGPAGAFDYAQAVPASGEGRLQAAAARDLVKLPDATAFWPAYRKDNTRSVLTDLPTPEKVALAWMHQPKAATVPTAPIVAGGLAIVGGQDGVIRALDAATGTVRWSAYTGSATVSSSEWTISTSLPSSDASTWIASSVKVCVIVFSSPRATF